MLQNAAKRYAHHGPKGMGEHRKPLSSKILGRHVAPALDQTGLAHDLATWSRTKELEGVPHASRRKCADG